VPRHDPDAVRAAAGDRTAAVMLEPIQGETGVNVIPDEVIAAAREACDSAGALLVFDEIQTGMGRTGSLWAYEQTPVRPDVMTSAKALGGGLPIGALITGERLSQVLQPGDHGSTFAGGAVVTAAANAALDVLEDPALHARARDLGERIAARLEELPGVRAVRHRGLMVGFDVTGTDAPGIVRRALLEQRLVCNATGPETIRFLPPLIIGEAEADDAVDRIAPLLAEAA
jgi:acetylornithine/succinyldiaminopimelate/putrescine aminotransferase